MKFSVFVVVALCVAVVASAEALPEGFNSPADIASVLANEPPAAKDMRFAQTGSSGSSDSITFSDNGLADAGGEFDGQIEQVEQDIKKLEERLKEATECAMRAKEHEAEIKQLKEQKNQLQKEKEKKILSARLEKQMRDLGDINRMSRSLRNKFQELKRTQMLINSKITGTKTSLSQLESESVGSVEDVSAGVVENIQQVVDTMQKAQQSTLGMAHGKNIKSIANSINQVKKTHIQNLKEAQDPMTVA